MKNFLFLLLIVCIQIHAADRTDVVSRGKSNRNPLNLIYTPSNKWKGQIGSDGRFCRFDSELNGLRAAVLTLRTYIEIHGIDTISLIISRWAPRSENRTDDYIGFVSRMMKRDANSKLRFQEADICALVAAMARIESEMIIDEDIIRKAFLAAEASVAQH